MVNGDGLPVTGDDEHEQEQVRRRVVHEHLRLARHEPRLRRRRPGQHKRPRPPDLLDELTGESERGEAEDLQRRVDGLVRRVHGEPV